MNKEHAYEPHCIATPSPDADRRQVRWTHRAPAHSPAICRALATSIATDGLLQPIGVRPDADGRFRVVYGGRRLAAAVKLGLAEVPCLVLDEGGDPLVQQILENVQRRDLGDMEKARAFARLGERITAETPGCAAARCAKRSVSAWASRVARWLVI